MIYGCVFCPWGNIWCWRTPAWASSCRGQRGPKHLCTWKGCAFLYLTHGRPGSFIELWLFHSCWREEGLPSLGVSYFMCSPFLSSSHGARGCHGFLSVPVHKLSLLTFAALPAVPKMHFLICCVIVLGLLFSSLLKTSKRVHLTMKAGTNVFLLVGNNEKSERLMCCCCLFSTALLVTNYNGWDLLSASLNKLIM